MQPFVYIATSLTSVTKPAHPLTISIDSPEFLHTSSTLPPIPLSQSYTWKNRKSYTKTTQNGNARSPAIYRHTSIDSILAVDINTTGYGYTIKRITTKRYDRRCRRILVQKYKRKNRRIGPSTNNKKTKERKCFAATDALHIRRSITVCQSHNTRSCKEPALPQAR